MEFSAKSIPSAHWQFYLDIEADLLRTTKYVEFCEEHRGVFSVVFARTLISASAEFEVVCKAVCETIESDKALPSQCKIHHIRDALSVWGPHLQNGGAKTKFGGLVVKPFVGWFPDGALGWWQSYNNVKHARHQNFMQGNLEQALHSVAALFLMNIVLANRHSSINLRPRSRLFLPLLPGNHDWRFVAANPYSWLPIGSRTTDRLNRVIFGNEGEKSTE